MSRTTSSAFKAAAFSAETGEVLVCLLTITHPDLDSPIRISSDPTTRLSTDPLAYGTASRGETFLFLPFGFTLPDDRDDTPPRVQIALDNVDRGIIGLLRTIATPATVRVEVVLASDPGTVEIALPALQMAEVSYDAATITVSLVADGLQTEPFPAGQFDPGRFPGLF